MNDRLRKLDERLRKANIDPADLAELLSVHYSVRSGETTARRLERIKEEMRQRRQESAAWAKCRTKESVLAREEKRRGSAAKVQPGVSGVRQDGKVEHGKQDS